MKVHFWNAIALMRVIILIMIKWQFCLACLSTLSIRKQRRVWDDNGILTLTPKVLSWPLKNIWVIYSDLTTLNVLVVFTTKNVASDTASSTSTLSCKGHVLDFGISIRVVCSLSCLLCQGACADWVVWIWVQMLCCLDLLLCIVHTALVTLLHKCEHTCDLFQHCMCVHACLRVFLCMWAVKVMTLWRQ